MKTRYNINNKSIKRQIMKYEHALSILSYFTNVWKPCRILNLDTYNYGVTVPSVTHRLLALEITHIIIEGLKKSNQFTFQGITWEPCDLEEMEELATLLEAICTQRFEDNTLYLS